MLISVVICTYNGIDYLRQQLDSIRGQLRQPDEVLIFDDVSGDDSAQFCAEYIRSNSLENAWRLSVNPRNLGFVANFCQAIGAARGDWVALCDQDDVWTPDKLLRMEECAVQHPDARAIAGAFDVIDSAGALCPASLHRDIVGAMQFPGGNEAQKLPNFSTDSSLLLKNFAPGCTLLVSRATCEAYLSHTRMEIPHDWELLIIAQMMDGLYYLNGPTTHYRIHDKNTIGVTRKKRFAVPSVSGRIRTLDTADAVLRAAQRYAPLFPGNDAGADAEYERFLRHRRRAYADGNVKDFYAMLRNRKIYLRMFTRAQRLGDLFAFFFGGRR
jgi:glycosyltransferase involved in cell wall biosynthesis